MRKPFTAALLASGNASAECEGKPLWQRQLSLLESLEPDEILIFGGDLDAYSNCKYRVLVDQESGMGPLSGFNCLLSACTTTRLLVLDVELPGMSRGVLLELLSFEDGVVPENEGHWEGAAAVYPVDILPLVRNTIRSPNRSLQAFVRLALHNGFIDTWDVPVEARPCFQKIQS